MLAELVLAMTSLNSPALPAARVEVLEGRAELATAAGVVRVAGAEPARTVAGMVYVELHVRARARVDWPGVASLELLGPTTLEWGYEPARSQALRLRIFTCQRLSFENRRAPLELELPGGWRVELPHGSGFVAGRHDGAFDVRLDAGSPSFVSVQTSPSQAWPALTVLPGAGVTLVPGRKDALVRDGSTRRVIARHARDEGEAWERARPSRPWLSRAWPWSTRG